ncbi:MAG: YraN family protein [Bacilli bacterium]
MKDRRKERGRIGEESAAQFLLKKGYRLVEKNWRCKFGEIDLIMKEAETLIVVEVRTTSSNRFGLGYESVDFRKQMKLKTLTNYYIQSRKINLLSTKVRIDVVSVLLDKGEQVISVTHIPHAIT